MSRRARILAFGSAAVMTVAGVLCAVIVPGLTGQVLTIVLVSLGLGGAVMLMFLEIGLSEERARERDDEERARRRAGRRPARRIDRRWSIRPPRRPG